MDPLTTLLAAAAATGPNTFQSQALTALRSAGPQESYFTRMGNPHPLQMQQLGQPTAPQLNPIITHPVSAPTALAQQIPMPILPLAHPMAEPATTGLHIPTLQAIHRMQQQAGPAPTMMPTMPQTPTVELAAALPRDPTEYTQANFPRLPQDSWPCWLSWRCRISKHCAAAHTTAYSLAIRQEQGDLHQAQARATHSPPAPHHVLRGQNRRHSSAFVQSHAQTDAPSPSKDCSRSRSRPQHRRHRRSRSHRQDRRSRSHRARRTHRHRPRTPRSRSPSRPSRDQAFILRSRSQLGKLPVPDLQLDEEWMTKWSYRAPPPQHIGPREGLSQSSQPQMETRAPSTSFMDLTQEATTASQQPPSRFRPSNYTVDLSNTTNPPPPQVMVKPAVMLRRDERPEPVSFSVTDAAQLSRTLSEMGSGSGIPEATYSELAAILLSSGRRDQAIDISSEVMAISKGVHQILFIP